MKDMHIAFCCDDGYIIPASITLESLLKNNRDRRIIAHTFTDDLNETSIARLKDLLKKYQGELVTHGLPKEAMEIIKNAPLAWEYLSAASYYRLMLPYVVDLSVEKILYLDCDVMVRKSLDEYYDCDLEWKYIAGSHDIEEEQHKERLQLPIYMNSGVVVMNVKNIRKSFTLCQMLKEIEEIVQRKEVTSGDQDIMNILFHQKAVFLPDAFNYQHGIHKKYVLQHQSEVQGAAVVHFITSDKPWFPTYVFPYTREYYGYLKKYLTGKEKLKYWICKPAGVVKVCKKHRDYMAGQNT